MSDTPAAPTPRSDAMDLGYAIGVLSNIAEGRGPAREMAKVALARIDERPCEQPDHKAYKVIDPEGAEDWLCEFDIRFLDEPSDAD